MEDNEEVDNDNYPMFTEHGGSIVDEPDDDFCRAILDGVFRII